MDPSDLRSRYDPSFPSHPLPPNFYPHPQFHPRIEPPHHPPTRQHRDHHPHPPYFPYPRVYPHELWDSVDVVPREIRAFHDRPVQLDWERDVDGRVYGRFGKDEILEDGFIVRVRKDEMLEEDFRVRAREDWVLNEGFRDRVRLRIRKDGTLEEDFSPRVLPPRVSDSLGISNSEIGFHGNLYMENKTNKDGFEENHFMGGKGKKKWVDMGNEDCGFRENRETNYMGNKGKRRNFNVGSSQHNEWISPKKTSALGRIQSGISVWNRIAEKPTSPSLLPCDSTQVGFVEDNQPEIDSLDLSYKSNALIAKVVVPSSPDVQPTSEGKSPRVVVPKDRLKMKKVVNDREQVVIPIVSRIGDGMQGDVSKPLTEGSKKAIGSYNKPASDGEKKAVDPSGKPFLSKKGIGSTDKPANDGLKKAVGSSNKPAVGSSSQSSNNKAAKVTSVKQIPVKRAVKAMEKNSADHNLEGKVNEGNPTKLSRSPLQPRLTAVKISNENLAQEQSNKDLISAHGPMEEIQSIMDNAAEQLTKDNTSSNLPTVVITSTEDGVAEECNKDVNFNQGPMFVSSESINVEQYMKDDNFIEPSMVGRTLSEKNPMEQSDNDANLVLEPMLATSLIGYNAVEQSSKNVNLVQDNAIDNTLKEGPTMLVEKIAQDSTDPVVSEARVVIDVSSDSSSEEVTVISSPDSKAICSVDDPNDEGSSKEIDVRIPSIFDSEVDMPSFNESSAFGLVGDEQVMHHVTALVGTTTSPNFHDSLQAGSVKEKEEGMEKQQNLAMPLVSIEFKFPVEQMRENTEVLLPNNACGFVQDQNQPHSASDKEDYDLGPIRGLPMSDSMPVFEDNSMNVAMSERMELFWSFSPLQKANSIDISVAQDASNFIRTSQSNSKLSGRKCFDNIENTNKQDEIHSSNNDSSSGSGRLLASETGPGTKSDKAMECYPPTSEKTYLLQSQELKKQISADTKLLGATTSKKSVMNSGAPRVFANQSSASGLLKESARLNHNARNKTWHRTDTPSSALLLHGKLQSTYKQSARKQSPKKLGRALNSSYVRKGNSLIRKPACVAHHPILPYGIDAASKKSQVDRSIDVRSIDNVKTCSNPSLERPKTPPLPLDSKFLTGTAITGKETPQLMPEDPTPEQGVETQVKSAEGQTLDLLLVSGDNPSIASGAMSEPLTGKRMIYVKHKSNQLVAASQSDYGDSSAYPTESNEKLSSSSSSDVYHVRKKNQLALNSLSDDTQHKKDGIVPIDNPNSSDRGASNVSSLESSRTSLLKKSLHKVARKICKHSKFSRVWTLNREESSKNDVASLNSWQVMPYLFPWKRTKYSKISRTALSSNRSSLSIISRKLQLARKRDTLYTVSTDGFSLRRAGVVSVGGSSLKWSKSIDRNSKKANEEATLAVAEVERKKREKKRSKSFGSREKKGHSFTRKSTLGIELQQGERVFRVGSVRYKMDTSKRTLIRMPDGQSPGAVGQQSGKNTFVPRRLLIGNDEYIRIGNGSQLVRDPKKLTRLLASEKVRWSLHAARLRLAKKQRYCQFFTRFGKCNKSSGRCPYIHDPEKVAICTKFLRGVCADATCKLTHKIIPARMPDCSYFLQGLCTNISCPYRHVHVNPKASVCDGFLRGYCADSDECRKKHSCVCPHFEATGECLHGSKCKLHHPKIRTKSKKRKRGNVQSNNKGRYFGSSVIKDGEKNQVVASDRHTIVENFDPFCLDGHAEFISIDVGNDGKTKVSKDYTQESDSELSDMHPDELDLLIKPVRIMNKTS